MLMKCTPYNMIEQKRLLSIYTVHYLQYADGFISFWSTALFNVNIYFYIKQKAHTHRHNQTWRTFLVTAQINDTHNTAHE